MTFHHVHRKENIVFDLLANKGVDINVILYHSNFHHILDEILRESCLTLLQNDRTPPNVGEISRPGEEISSHA